MLRPWSFGTLSRTLLNGHYGGPTVKGVQLPERFIRNGPKGRVLTVLSIWVPFEIVKFEDDCFWSWKVASINATGHRIMPTNAGCILWFELPIIAAPYFIVCQVALIRIQNMLSKLFGVDVNATRCFRLRNFRC
jgi:hypothetical protein